MILHILKRNKWDEAICNGSYEPPSVASEGFIHCSTIEQVVETANLYFRGQPDLVVLRIDEALLVSPLKFEAPAPVGDERTDSLFPHLYGLLNLDAVDCVCDFPCDANGFFELPATLHCVQGGVHPSKAAIRFRFRHHPCRFGHVNSHHL
jgi:uncharacterized protein (DUF952 family)